MYSGSRPYRSQWNAAHPTSARNATSSRSSEYASTNARFSAGTGVAENMVPLVERFLGLAPEESIVGYIYLGTCASTVPDRPRPDVGSLITWIDG